MADQADKPVDYKAFTKSKRDGFLTDIREGVQRGAAAEALGLDRRKVREYIATHADFRAAVEDAEVDATEHVQEALYQAAISGNVSAAKAWIEMNNPELANRGKTTRDKPPRDDAPSVPSAPEDAWADLDNVAPIRR